MDTGTLITLLVVALVVVVLLFLLRAAGVGRGRPKLRPLPQDSRDRYVTEWDEIETKFVDSPEQAVREAEALVMSVLRERGHPLTDRDLPQEVQRAHRLGYTSKDKTEHAPGPASLSLRHGAHGWSGGPGAARTAPARAGLARLKTRRGHARPGIVHV